MKTEYKGYKICELDDEIHIYIPSESTFLVMNPGETFIDACMVIDKLLGVEYAEQ